MARQPKGSGDGKLNIPQGTLDLLILTIVRREPLHGYGIAQRLKALTQGTFQINPGSLFPALYALELQETIALTRHRVLRAPRCHACGVRIPPPSPWFREPELEPGA